MSIAARFAVLTLLRMRAQSRLTSDRVDLQKRTGVGAKQPREERSSPRALCADQWLSLLVEPSPILENRTVLLAGTLMTATDVLCGPQFTSARGATTSIGGGVMYCVEPSPQTGMP